MKLTPLIAALVVSSVLSASAIDHKNLDLHRPLRLEDAYPVAHGEFNLHAGAGYRHNRRSSDHGTFPIEIAYGALPNFHVELGTTLFTSTRATEGSEHFGDLHLGALYNFNQETLSVPAFGLKGTVRFPTGVRSSGTDFELTGLVTKSFGRLSLHGNAAVEFAGATRPGERDLLYKFSSGPSYPVGAPAYTRTVLLGNVFVEQGHRRGERETLGVETGFRHQLTERMVLDAGIGTEFAGSRDRSPFYLTTGVSIAF